MKKEEKPCKLAVNFQGIIVCELLLESPMCCACNNTDCENQGKCKVACSKFQED